MSSAIDLFLHDVLDLSPKDARLGPERDAHGVGPALRMDALMSSPSLWSNLAFHEAWKAGTAGSRATRLDFEAFVARLPGALAGKGAAWSQTTMEALKGALAVGTHVRLHPRYQALEAAAGEAYQRTLASLTGNPATAATLLTAKLEDRFDSQSPPADVPPTLAARYGAMVTSDARLEALERWASASASASASPIVFARPRSVVEYYARAAAAAGTLDLPRRDPLTDLHVSIESSASPLLPPLSCVELLRAPLARDGHLWRRDSGGTIALLGSSQTMAALAEDRSFRFRRSREAPPELVMACLPPVVYARALVCGPVPTGPTGSLSVAELVRVLEGDASEASEASDGGRPQDRVIRVSVKPPADLGPREYWMPSGTGAVSFGCREGSPPAWARPLQNAMLAAHMQKPCPLRLAAANVAQAGAIGGELLLHRFLARYASVRELGSRVFVTALDAAAPGTLGEVVLIDNRPSVCSVLSLLVTLDNLRAAEWSVAVFCARSNLEFMRANVLVHAPHARVEAIDEMSGEGPFDIETYNLLLKSVSFWRDRVRSPRRVLIVQDDGMLVRPGLEDDEGLMSQAYVGAPWLDAPDNRRTLQAAGVGGGLVGNGGLSLRDVATAREIVEQDAAHGRATFNGNMQPVPEDVFFAAAVERRGLSCPRDVAQRFAFEEKIPDDPRVRFCPLGFHKPWPYVPPAAFAAYLDNLLNF